MTPNSELATTASPFRLDGRVVLVTGASAGIGARCARGLHAAGADLILTARRGDRLDALADDLGTGVMTVPGDLREIDFRAALISSISDSHSRLDVLVNNAGVCDTGTLTEQTLEEIIAVIDLNLIAALDLCRLAQPLLVEAGGSSVINIASIYGLVGSRSPMMGYNVSKGALVQFTRHLAAQWGPLGVRVNAVAPGFFPTDLTGHLVDRRQRARIEQRTMLGRVPELTEIAGPVVFLASSAASYVTGQVLAVDGGWTAG